MKYTILHNWNILRLLRLILGTGIAVQGFMVKDWLFALAGILFTLMAIFNAGCCSTGTCYPADNKKSTIPQKEIIYEEVDKQQ